MIKIFDNEEERRKSIESKAAHLLGSISIATSLVISSTSLITGKDSINPLAIKISVIISLYYLFIPFRRYGILSKHYNEVIILYWIFLILTKEGTLQHTKKI